MRSSGWPTPLRCEMSFIVMTQGFYEDGEMQQFEVLLGETILILPKESAKGRIKKSQSRNPSLIAAARGRERAI